MISQKTRQSLMVAVAALLIFLGTIVTIYLAQGYRINPKNWAIYTTGLVIVNSQPSGSKIYLNDTDTRTFSPARFESVEPGPLSIRLTHPKYQTWQSTKQVRAYEVVYADYAVMVPIQISQVRLNPAISFETMTQTNDRKTLFGVSRATPDIWRVRNNFLDQVYAPQTTALALTKISNLVSNTSGDRLIFHQTTVETPTPNILYLDTNSKKTTNLTTAFGTTLQDVRFSLVSNDQLYWLSEANLRRINVSSQTVTNPLAQNVISFTLTKTNILTVERDKPSDGQSHDNLYRYDLDGTNRKLISSLNSLAPSYDITFSKGQFEEYLYVYAATTQSLLVIRAPYSSNPITKVLTGITGFTTNANGRFLVVSDKRGMRSYDLEFINQTRSDVQLPNYQTWTWYGEYQLIFVRDNKTYIVDFDGQNLQQLSQSNLPTTQAYPYIIEKGFYTLSQTGQLVLGSLQAK
jgi:hypothetical protein